MDSQSKENLYLFKIQLTELKSEIEANWSNIKSTKDLINEDISLPHPFFFIRFDRFQRFPVFIDSSINIIERFIRDAIEIRFSKTPLGVLDSWEKYCLFDKELYFAIYKLVFLHFTMSVELPTDFKVLDKSERNKLFSFIRIPEIGYLTVLYNSKDNQNTIPCLVNLPSCDEIDEIIYQSLLAKSFRLDNILNHTVLKPSQRLTAKRELSIYQNIILQSKSRFLEYLMSEVGVEFFNEENYLFTHYPIKTTNRGSANTKLFLEYLFNDWNVIDVAKEKSKLFSTYLREYRFYEMSDFSNSNYSKAKFDFLRYSSIKDKNKINKKLSGLIKKSLKDYIEQPELYVSGNTIKSFEHQIVNPIGSRDMYEQIFHLAVLKKYPDYIKEEIF